MKKILFLLLLAVMSITHNYGQADVAPHLETFSGGALPTNWVLSNTSGDDWRFIASNNSVNCPVATDHTPATVGSPAGYAWHDHSGFDAGVIMEMNDVDVAALTVPWLEYYYWMCGVGYAPINEIYVEVWDGTLWNIVQSNLTATSGWEERGVDLTGLEYTGSLVKIRFRSESGGSGSDFFGDPAIDDVFVREAPTCIKPTLPVTSLITPTTATLGWTGGGTLDIWYVEYGLAGFTPGIGSGTVIFPISPMASTNLTGLIPDTNYDWYVRSFCNVGDTSDNVGPTSFLTTSTCPVPTALNAAVFDGTSVALDWTTGGATEWHIEYGPSGYTPGSAAGTFFTTTSNPDTITGLPVDVTYDWYVRDYCLPADSSLWVAGTPFHIGYCIPEYGTGCSVGDVIARVKLNTLDNISGPVCDPALPGAPPGYADYSADPLLTTTLIAGSNYQCQVFTATFAQGFKVWIDYNNDLVFDASEVVGNTTVAVPVNDSIAFPLNVACNPTPGAYRMRVRCVYNQGGPGIDPCVFQSSWGETEDYTITIAPPPPCPEIANLTVSNVAATAADLAWNTGCAETAWDLEISLDATPPAGVPTIASHPDSTYAATGLMEDTIYYAHVRANCGINGVATWTTVSFTTPPFPPANDTCFGATTLTVNADLLCTVVTPGTIAWATGDTIPNNCTGTANDDVWFEFTAVGSAHTISLENITNGTTDLEHTVYDATPGCGNLGAELSCNGANNSTASGLTPGTTYLIRVYSWTATPGQTTEFNVCIGTPPQPPVNDTCINAITLTVNADLNCGSVTAGTIASATTSSQANTCTGTADDDVWFEFTATDTTHTVDLLNFAGGTTDMVHGVYDATAGCAALPAPLYCSDPNNSVASGLTVGNTYLVRVYSWTATAGQNSTFDVCIGTPPPLLNDECIDALTLTVNPDLNCGSVTAGTISGATASAQANTCTGTANDDVWFEFTAVETTHTVDLINVGGGTTDLVHGVYDATAGCAALPAPLYCSDPNNSVATGLTVGNTYLVRVYSWTGTAGQTTNFDVCVGTLPPVPANDSCVNAIAMTCGSTETAITVSATSDAAMGNCGVGTGGVPGIGVWYSFVGTGEDVQVSLCGSDFDTKLHFYEGVCGALTCIDSNDDGPLCGGGLQSSMTFSSTLGAQYYFLAGGFGTATGNLEISVSCIPTGSVTWLGLSTNYLATTNWSSGIVPDCSVDVFVPLTANDPIITGAFACNDFGTSANVGADVTITGTLGICGDVSLSNGTVISGDGVMSLDGTSGGTSFDVPSGTATVANIDVTSPYAFTGSTDVTGGIVLSGDDMDASGATVTLKSSATGTAYLDDFTGAGTYTGDITVENFVTTGSGLGQRFFGSAVDGGQIQGLDQTYATGYPLGQITPVVCNVSLAATSAYSNMFRWRENSTFPYACEQEGWWAISQTTAMNNAEGYSGWMTDGSLISVSGAPNTGNVDLVTTGVTGNAPAGFDGWHLLSNPYPSPINVAAFTGSGFTSPQLYNGASGPFYGTFTPAALVGTFGSMQGFFAESTGTGTLTTTNADRVASNATAFVSSSTLFNQMLTINVNGNGFADKTYLYYSNDNSVTTGFDDLGDCKKRSSDVGQPTIYTSLGTEKMALNGYPTSTMGESIPMGIDHGSDGNFELSFEGMSNFPSNTTIYVEDMEAGVYHNIANGNYAYTATAAHHDDRFMIHFVLPIELASVNVNCAGDLGLITLEPTAGLVNRDFVITDATSTIAAGSLSTLNESVNAGIYDVTVNDAFGGNQLYTIVIGEEEVIEASYTVSSIDVQVGEVVAFNNTTTNATNVEWNIADLATVTGVNNATYSFDAVGTYVIELEVSNEDCSDVKSFEVNVSNKTTSVTTLSKDNLIKVYSNEDVVTIVFDNNFDTNAKVGIQNVIGQKVFDGTVTAEGTQTIKIGDVTTGYYFVSVEVEGERLSSKVFLTKK